MKEQDKKMVLPKLDDLFTSQEQRDNPVVDEVKEIELYKIGEFPDHPFRVIDDDKMEEMVKSVKEHGVLLPVIVRKRGEGNYQMISGHRRKRACELAGIDKIKCIVKELTDDEATILMVDSNIQREEILPSEKAFAYKMKLEAMKHQGKRVDLEEDITSRPLGDKLKSAERMGEEVGESARTIQRYIRLTYLIPELLEQVDNKRIAFRPAVELSYLSEENQYVVENIFEFDEVTPSLSQAIRLKKLEQEGNLTEEKIEEILQQEKPNQKEYIKIPVSKIEKNKWLSKMLKQKLTTGKAAGWTFFGGVFSKEWEERMEDAGVEYWDLMKDANVVHQNAYITAEATVAEILKYSDYSIRGQKIIVSGYGRCGREIANILGALGAKVTVLA